MFTYVMRIILKDKISDNKSIINKVIGILDDAQLNYKFDEIDNDSQCTILFHAQSELTTDYLIVELLNKEVIKINLHDIRYITTKNRNTVVQLPNEKVETKKSITQWKSLLDQNIYAVPHNSYIVNLNFVTEISKKVIKVNDGKSCYLIYPSQRKFVSFKRAFLNYKKDCY